MIYDLMGIFYKWHSMKKKTHSYIFQCRGVGRIAHRIISVSVFMAIR